jgi:hypothetical protein
MRQVLYRLKDEGGVIEKRQGHPGHNSRFMSSYYTAASQPRHAAWYAQRLTVVALVHKGALVVEAADKDGPTRCRLSDAMRDAPSIPKVLA